MDIRSVANTVSSLSIVVGFFICSSALVSFLCQDSPLVIYQFLICGLIPIILGSLIFYFTKEKEREFGLREGFGIVSFGWIFSSIFGALPFIVIMKMHWYDAFFETMSGFTTTGASVIDKTLTLADGTLLKSGIADLPKGLLYWRSMTHWLGGMGIVVLSLAILPFLGVGGHQLYMAETTGADKNNKLTPRIANTARMLWSVYFLITIVETILLYLGGMTFLEAWCHACATVATGGFSTEQASIAAFNSLYLEIVIMFFMFISGANFVLHYQALKGKPFSYFKDEEFLLYSIMLIFGIISISFFIAGGNILLTDSRVIKADFGNSFRYAAFQLISVVSSTGFATADVGDWPTYCKFMILLFTFVAACAGSTSGGLKVVRLIICFKYLIYRIRASIFPNMVRNSRFNQERMDGPTIHKTLAFFFAYTALAILTATLISAIETSDMETNISATIACMSNVGPGLGKVSQINTYSWFCPTSKVILSLAMLIGRLEVFTVFVIFLPSFWKR